MLSKNFQGRLAVPNGRLQRSKVNDRRRIQHFNVMEREITLVTCGPQAWATISSLESDAKPTTVVFGFCQPF